MEPTTGQWSLPNAPREGETNAFEGPVSYRHERERAKEGGEIGVFGEEKTLFNVLRTSFVYAEAQYCTRSLGSRENGKR